ncbi:MAG: methylmalonyl Co-A mutase-associated GTPase MeaB [Desulfobacterales bacterium]|nr:methylmalonyl Co-A mutase-associated GTPase MeaB [Desulfobacterales bacterium]
MVKSPSSAELIGQLFGGDRQAAARLITRVENRTDDHQEIMKQIYPRTGHAMIVGVTGSGGVGKSSLTDHIIQKFRARGQTVGAVLVDPSSPFSGGAFLGDSIRLQRHTRDDGVFIRSLASRGYRGGLSRATYDVTRIMEAMGRDVIIVETLGAGQDEIDVVHIAQTCLLVISPGMGDDIQAMKAGIMEIADIIVINKADLNGAENCRRHMEAALNTRSFTQGQWVPRVIPTISVATKPALLRGIEALMDAIADHQKFLHATGAMEKAKLDRIEQELGHIFRDELQKLVVQSLEQTGKKETYIRHILDGRSDPYSVVHEILRTCIRQENGERGPTRSDGDD